MANTFAATPTTREFFQDLTVPNKRASMSIATSNADSGDIDTTINGGVTWLAIPAIVNHNVAFDVSVIKENLPGGQASFQPQTLTATVDFDRTGFDTLIVTFKVKVVPGRMD